MAKSNLNGSIWVGIVTNQMQECFPLIGMNLNQLALFFKFENWYSNLGENFNESVIIDENLLFITWWTCKAPNKSIKQQCKQKTVQNKKVQDSKPNCLQRT